MQGINARNGCCLIAIGGDDEEVGSKHRALTQHGTAKAVHSASQPAKQHAHADGAETAVQGNVQKA